MYLLVRTEAVVGLQYISSQFQIQLFIILKNEDLDPSLYKKIFRRGIISNIKDQLLNVTLLDSIAEIPDEAFWFKILYDADDDADDQRVLITMKVVVV